MNIVGYKIAPVLAVAVLLATPTPCHAFFQEVKSEFRYQGASVWQAVLDPLATIFEPLFYTPPTLPGTLPLAKVREGKGQEPETKELLVINNPQTNTPSKQEVLNWIRDILKLQNTETYTSVPMSVPSSVPSQTIYNTYPTEVREIRTTGSSQGLADSLSSSLTTIDSRFTTLQSSLTNSYTFLSPSLTNATLTGETTIHSHLLLSATSAPSTTSNRLYNTGGDLYWAGSLIGGATTGNWTSDGTNVWRSGGNVGVGTSSPYTTFSVAGAGNFSDNTKTGGLRIGDILIHQDSNISNLYIGRNVALNGGALSGYYNTVVGLDAGSYLGNGGGGNSNTFVGRGTGQNTSTGVGNVFVGINAGNQNTSGTNNVAIGPNAGYVGSSLSTGSYNIFLTSGQSANVTSGSNNIIIGGSAPSDTGSQQLSIGDIIYGQLSQGVIGISTTSPFAKFSISNTAGIPGFVVGSSTATSFIVDKNGRVGVGTASPFTALHVVGTSGGTAGTFTDNVNATLRISFPSSAVAAIASNEGSHSIAFGGQSSAGGTFTERFRINNVTGNSYFSSGNVGVGSTTPSGRFAITGAGTGTAKSFVVGDSNNTERLSLLDNGTFSLDRGGLYYNSANGNVGIGYTSPGAKLSFGTSGVGSELINFYDAGGTSDYGIGLQSSEVQFYVPSSGRWSFNSGGSIQTSGTNEVMRIMASGNVGIGTTTPWGLLSVNANALTAGTPQFVVGSSTATNFIVANNGNVGVGTANPTALLDVRGVVDGAVLERGINLIADSYPTQSPQAQGGSITVTAGASSGSSRTGGTVNINAGAGGINAGNGGAITLTPGTASTNGGLGGALILRGGLGTAGGGTGGVITFSTAATTAYAEAMRIANNGNVYIGNATPGAPNKFVVNDQSSTGTTVGSNIIASFRSHATGRDATISLSDNTSYSGTISMLNGDLHLSPNAAASALTAKATTGFVGIGSTTPWGLLSVNANGLAAGTPQFVVGSSTATNFIVANGGNVGVGKLAPSQALDVQGRLRLAHVNTDATRKFGIVQMGNFNNVDGDITLLYGDTANGLILGGGISGQKAMTSIQLYTAANLTTDTGTERVRIDSAGLVGIGTTSPSAKLSVKGGGTTTGRAFAISNSSDAEKFTVLDNGNVGVGNTSPTALLEIKGISSTPLIKGVSSGGTTILNVDNTGDATLSRLTVNYSGSYTTIGSAYYLANTDWGTLYTTSGGGSTVTGTALISKAGGNANMGWIFRNHLGTNVMEIKGDTGQLYLNGSIGVSTTSPWRTLSVAGTAAFSGLVNDSTGYYACVNTTTGQLATSTTACGASSERFKENIQPITYGLSAILSLRPVSFDYKPSYIKDSTHQLGFIAEEVDLLIPELVAKDAEGQIQGLDYPKFTSVIVKAVQELSAKVDSLMASAGNAFGWLKFNEENKLCVKNTCITEEQFEEMILRSGVGATETVGSQQIIDGSQNSGDSSVPSPDQGEGDTIVTGGVLEEQNSSSTPLVASTTPEIVEETATSTLLIQD